MKRMVMATAVLSVAVWAVAVLLAQAGEGSAAKGKMMFNDAMLSGAKGGVSCNTCHPDGKGLENAARMGKNRWKNPAGIWTSLEDANNVCILVAVKGKTLDPDSQEMADLVAYIKSIGMKM